MSNIYNVGSKRFSFKAFTSIQLLSFFVFLFIHCFSSNTQAQSVYYLSNETFPNYTVLTGYPATRTFTGSIGTWTAVSNQSYGDVDVLDYTYNYTYPNAVRMMNYKGAATSNVSITSPNVNLSSYACSQKVWLQFGVYTGKLVKTSQISYRIEFSNNGGSTWTTVNQQTSDQLVSQFTDPSGWNQLFVGINSSYLVSNFRYRITGINNAGSGIDSEIWFDDFTIIADACRRTWTNICTDNKNVDFYSKSMTNTCVSGSLGWTNIDTTEGLNMTNATEARVYVSTSEDGSPTRTVTVRAKNSSGTVLQTLTLSTPTSNQEDPSPINIYEFTFTSLTGVSSFEASVGGTCSTTSTSGSFIANGLGVAIFRNNVSGYYNAGELVYWGAPGNGLWDYYKTYTLPTTTYAKTAWVELTISGLTNDGKGARINVSGSNGTITRDIYNTDPSNPRMMKVTIPYTIPANASSDIVVSTDGSFGNNGVYSLDFVKVSSTCTQPVSLGNLVFADVNNNGVKDASEVGMGSVRVNLYEDSNGDNVPDGKVLYSTTTDFNGQYIFNGLNAGNYIVGVVTPSGYTSSSATTTSSNPNNDTDNDNNGITVSGLEVRSNFITLSVGGEPAAGVDGDDNNGNQTLDFGFYYVNTGICGSTSFNPTLPANGYDVFIQNGVTITGGHTDGGLALGGDLTLNGSGIIVGMANSGAYPSGYNNNSNYTLLIGGRVNYTSGGITYVNSNGDLKLGNTTGTTLWEFDPNGATVNLRLTSNASTGWTAYNSTPSIQLNSYQAASTATGSSGINFTSSFSTLSSYASTMSGYSSGSACASNLNIISVSGTTPTIALASNKVNVVNITAANFAAITSITFSSAPTANSPLIFNINSTTGFTWTSFNATGINNSDGRFIIYNFYNNTGTITINAGNVVRGTIFAPTATVVWNGTNNIEGQIISKAATIAAGEIHTQIFAACLPACTNVLSLGNTVWDDNKCSYGTKDPSEPGYAGLTVNLYQDADANNVPDGAAIATATTNTSGVYSFSNLYPGNYIVGVVLPSKYVGTKILTTSANPNNDTDNDNNGVMLVSGELRSNYITLSVGGEPASGVDGDGTNGNQTLDFGIAKDTDGDGIPDNVDIDDDNDGITDVNESGGYDPYGDCDNDCIPNYLDSSPGTGCAAWTDCNSDGINDFFDWDRDGIINSLDLDSDNDGILDVQEARPGSVAVTATSNGMITGTDADGNGLLSSYDNGNVNPVLNGIQAQDLDRDGTPNFLDLDSDGDGMTDVTEALKSYDTDGLVNGSDTDGDGVRAENFGSTSASVSDNINGFGAKGLALPDSDSDGYPDMYDVDSDNDGITDNTEAQATCTYKGPSGVDCDADGVDDNYDVSSPCVTCTRTSAGLTPYDKDGDTTPDYLDLDTDNDGALDIYEGHSINSTVPPANYWTSATGDTDKDGLINYFDNFNILLETGVYYSNVTSNNMGTNGSFSPTVAKPGSIVQLPENDGKGGCAGGGERDWRTTLVLPASLVKFYGNLNNNITRLTWTVAGEINMDKYVVERSTDGLRFNTVATVAAKNQNSASNIDYNINDNITGVTTEKVYYRLKMVEADGSYRYSNVINFKLTTTKTGIIIYPNPAISFFTIKVNATKESIAVVRLIDVTGRAVMTQNNKVLSGLNTFTFNGVAQLSAGTYTVQILMDNEVYTEKLTINR